MAAIDYDKRAARGAARLDKYGPANWRQLVEPRQLVMSSPGSCVLGQVYGSYWTGLKPLKLDDVQDRTLARYGFDLNRGRDGYDVGSYSELRDAWVRLLES